MRRSGLPFGLANSVASTIEYIFLMGRDVLVDQMAFLRARFPRSNPLPHRLVD